MGFKLKTKPKKINFVSVKKRLLEIEVFYFESDGGKVFKHKQSKIFVSVPLLKKINVKELEEYATSKLKNSNLRKLEGGRKKIKVSGVQISPFGFVLDLKGEL